MPNRRRHARFALTHPWCGTLHTLRDVIVEPHRWQDRPVQFAIISQTPDVPDETMTLAIIHNGDSAKVRVRVMDTRPIFYEGSLRHRLCLSVIGLADPHIPSASAPAATPEGLPSVATAGHGDLFGVIGRAITVRLLNLSGSGCLLDSSRPLDIGSTGEVRLVSNRHTYRDELRITRCHPVTPMGSVCLAGAEFLWAQHPDKHTLRRVSQRLQRDLRPGDVLEDAG